ncbi:GNAT family N-acetyltransferase [Bacillus alveayuensis]|uniref:GNAT superfamily N-acetyltransferase n=1 Tax=Aeribacillus alveayuensis TaxID=279215 RepID=A0ABT9VTA5_9BACI|nr:GNAT family N-acetyltransferase [Bacillus alveayuensis]MDQ0164087.1 GNAT superfamily N-acetyltransferase [Bacillus alveayuensis]
MNLEKIEFLPLDKTYHLVQGFSCGNSMIDTYIKLSSNAIYDHKMGISSTTTLIYENEITAYFTANCAHLEIPVEEAREIGLMDSFYIPAIEVKYIGVKDKYQKKGIGSLLLKFIVGKALEITPFFTCRYIFLWAVEDAIEFYQKRYFKLTGKEEDGLYLMKFLVPTYPIEEEI